MAMWLRAGSLAAAVALACTAGPVSAESPVQPSWHCEVGGRLVVSNTPCKSGAQPVVQAGSSVIYRCKQNGVVSFQQGACKNAEAAVHLHNDQRTKATIATADQVRHSTVARANQSRAAQMSREKGGGVTVIGQQKTGNYTAGDGKADGYRNARSETQSHTGY